MGLDTFCSRYTSEDNASFLELQERDAASARAKRPWLLGPGPGGETCALYGDPAPRGGLALTAAEAPRQASGAVPSVNPAATRFAGQEPRSILPTPQGSERGSLSGGGTPPGGWFSLRATPLRDELGRGLAEAALRRKETRTSRRGGGGTHLSPAPTATTKRQGTPRPLSPAGQRLARSLRRKDSPLTRHHAGTEGA